MTDQQDGEGRVITPAKAWQRPPFEHGHTLSVRHGAYSPRLTGPVVEQLVDQVLTAIAPEDAYLADPKWRPRLVAWAEAEATLDRLRANVSAGGMFDAHGQERPAFKALARWESIAANRAADLGLTPASWARLRRDLAEGTQAASAAARLAAKADEHRAPQRPGA